MTKQEILNRLKELGVEASPDSHFKTLEKQLKEIETSERITAPQEDHQLPEVEEEPEDYLRQYQYRQGAEPGSEASDPQPGSKAEVMKKKLLKQPRISTFIPRPPGEDPDIYQSVTLNDYRLDLPKDTYLELPKQVAETIRESHKQQAVALRQELIAGNKEKEAALN